MFDLVREASFGLNNNFRPKVVINIIVLSQLLKLELQKSSSGIDGTQ